ncbi:hypothetical protein [Sphingomonas glaciei]|uniref:Uncharacterized protein n=1 Tax=Sphingomonas glaciei TaxID=2938948 RepID=A0ABY5MUA1_9SPHN|nr:hypothetical protein [Sphingomonas glaciei]UUR07361.1 hypothetical protein M1K48_10460 [Sphingomonas glaciei]
MQKPVFGRKMASLPKRLDVVLAPQGAANSSRQWSLAEALAMFMDHATEDAFFEPHELIADGWAAFRAYRWAGEIDSRPLSDWLAGSTEAERSAVRFGLELIGRRDVAACLEAGSEPHPTPDMMEIAAEVGDWLRRQEWLVILGDGDKDFVYKEVMKRLHRTNPQAAARAGTRRLSRAQAERLADPAIAGPTVAIGALIAEVERLPRG